MTAAVTEAPEAETPPFCVVRPGIYDIGADAYHADPVPGGSLSSTGARKLLPPSCPALFKHELDQGRPPKREFDLGAAAHKLVLGVGEELVVVDRPRWDTNEAKSQVAEIRAAGAIPLKRSEWDQVNAMAAAIRAHPIASALFNPSSGTPEQSLFWQDKRTGIWRRARIDWLRHPSSRRLIVADYKTTRSAAPDELEHTISTYGYHRQADWYLDAVQAVGLGGDDAMFLLVFQEKAPPYLVTVVQPDPYALRVGAYLNRRAVDTYAECVTTGRWPGYSDDVEMISLPAWVERKFTEVVK